MAVISRQSSLPSDTVFGRWMSQTGWAGPLVVLSFSCSWVLPLLTSLVAGDVFAAEDRLGTWRHLLVAVRSPFDGHLLAPGQAAGAVLLGWAGTLAPTLVFAAVGLLGSVALGRLRGW